MYGRWHRLVGRNRASNPCIDRVPTTASEPMFVVPQSGLIERIAGTRSGSLLRPVVAMSYCDGDVIDIGEA